MNKDINKILLLAVSVIAAIPAVAQHSTMLVRTTDGAVVRTNVSDVNKITFSDTTYSLTASGDRILSYDEVRWPEDRLIPVFQKPATRVRTLDMNAASLSDAERLMFCTLEGIVNRTRPRILLYNHQPKVRIKKYMDLGQKYLSEMNYDEALLAFGKVIELDPKQIDAYEGMADAYEGRQDYEKAAETLERGIEAAGADEVDGDNGLDLSRQFLVIEGYIDR